MSGYPGGVDGGDSRVGGGANSSVDKTLAVLDALGEHERIADIAAATGLPKSTVHRILQTFVRQGYARTTDAGTYVGGPRILLLAGRVMAKVDPAQHVDAELRRLCERTSCTVHFAMLNGDELFYAAKISGRKPYRMASRVGMGLPLHSTSIGKAVLAARPEDAARELIDRTELTARTPRTITDPGQLTAHLTEVRKHGYAVDDEENEAGVRCVGAAVLDHVGRVVGAVSLSFLVADPDHGPVETLGEQVAETARAVSLSLGAQPAEDLTST
jgi:IclR family acetate operon transcriptional repressor